MNFGGCLILVSHDRYFLDKLTDHLFIFEGKGKVKDYYGSYTKYNFDTEKGSEERKDRPKTKEKRQKPKVKTKLSYKEQLEYDSLEKEIEVMETEKAKAETIINSGIDDYEKLTRLSERIAGLMELIDEKTLRWMELDEVRERGKVN